MIFDFDFSQASYPLVLLCQPQQNRFTMKSVHLGEISSHRRVADCTGDVVQTLPWEKSPPFVNIKNGNVI